ncbi:18206_t:CDS:10 [Acaulospora morrowiae]|uniref:18206_t:CDS:1 n=1 Tax=Acaulospora morrowiae TaxID=94023 RepID=A0A9N9AZ14_9GLOM|nr:18206_t:CDS:10 [Acaulospora morrowiae]
MVHEIENNADSQDSKLIDTFKGFCMNVNNMIGSGIFSTPGLIWYLTGSGGMTLLLYVVGSLFSFAGSLIYVELGSKMPESGGEQRYLENSFPNPDKVVGYIFSFCTITGAIITDAIIASEYIIYARSNDTTTLNPEGYVASFLFWETLTLLVISIIGLTEITKNPGKLTWNALFAGTKGIDDFGNYCSSMLQVLFAYEGWNNLNYSLSEMNDVSRRLKYSNLLSVFLLHVYFALDHDEAHRGTYKEIMSATLGDVIDFRRGISALVALSSIGAASSLVWGGSRIIASAADSKFIPYFSSHLKEFQSVPRIISRRFQVVNVNHNENNDENNDDENNVDHNENNDENNHHEAPSPLRNTRNHDPIFGSHILWPQCFGFAGKSFFVVDVKYTHLHPNT